MIEREKAAMGLFLTLDAPTGPMMTEATSAGVYEPTFKTRRAASYPRLQILTIGELLAGRQAVALPSTQVTYKTAERAKEEGGEQLGFEEM